METLGEQPWFILIVEWSTGRTGLISSRGKSRGWPYFRDDCYLWTGRGKNKEGNSPLEKDEGGWKISGKQNEG